MQERNVRSQWLGLECECYLDGEIVRGDVRDLSSSGFFVEMAAPLEPGREVELRLVGGEAPYPIRLSGVVESCQAPGTSGAEKGPGVRFRLLRFSREFSRLISGEKPTKQRLKAAPSGRRTGGDGDGEREWLSETLASDNDKKKPSSEPEPAAWEEEGEPLSERAGEPLWSEDSIAPEAIVIDDGELDDVVGILAELGVKTERQSPRDDSLPASWMRPQHLLVVTAKRALKLRLPLGAESQRFTSVSVADSDARMVCSAVRRLGYHYAVSRPIHPLALSMLFRQAIFPHTENRAVPREILGCSVHWWCGWGRKRPGVILDMSPVSCQLLVQEAEALGSAVKIRVPEGIANGGAFTLTGEVIRSSRVAGGTRLVVSFGDLSEAVLARLQQVLALPGPCRLTGDLLMPAGESAIAPESDRAEQESAAVDRRQEARSAMRREVVALEHSTSQVRHVLVSSDLSVHGMRVEAHPALALGDQMDLVLYEDSEGAPLILSAEVARDDGRLGWWCRFVGITPEVREQLTSVLDRFPPVTRLDEPEPESGRVVLGQLVVHRKSITIAEPELQVHRSDADSSTTDHGVGPGLEVAVAFGSTRPVRGWAQEAGSSRSEKVRSNSARGISARQDL
jgi:hypothetical protein